MGRSAQLPSPCASLAGAQSLMHLPRGLIAVAQILLASLEQDFIENLKATPFTWIFVGSGKLWKLLAVFASADFIQHLAKAIEVRFGAPRPFRRNVAQSSDIRIGVISLRN